MFDKMGSMYTDKADNIIVHSGDNPKVFFDIEIGGESAGKVVMELFADTVPKVGLLSGVNVATALNGHGQSVE